ncbi:MULTISPECIES: hypothetical protein [Vibrio]|uniref:Uncharacterized protein n=1 Tax=Vibrio tasmaniensis TaxID=212663 RepID=A0A2N7NCR6_9VIBR|nr:hypothetical protein [Vibrio tasmaniensis]PMO89833.1 hypothetical protein BCT01_00700 [Vibrio tasmaniensis]PMP09994.1 hypothetical protein BCS92_02390 [Vibrio tasmaniensis]TKG32622.1 hypothetical protein FC057_12460 [Vibrio tasmaniensis]TKG41694.1 hypothetical protein FC063_07480 [Vibrio tasmaniensis]TKG52049.1 hypothetical protein FC070_09750 [Vibrio tasmaniensis]
MSYREPLMYPYLMSGCVVHQFEVVRHESEVFGKKQIDQIELNFIGIDKPSAYLSVEDLSRGVDGMIQFTNALEIGLGLDDRKSDMISITTRSVDFLTFDRKGRGYSKLEVSSSGINTITTTAKEWEVDPIKTLLNIYTLLTDASSRK